MSGGKNQGWDLSKFIEKIGDWWPESKTGDIVDAGGLPTQVELEGYWSGELAHPISARLSISDAQNALAIE